MRSIRTIGRYALITCILILGAICLLLFLPLLLFILPVTASNNKKFEADYKEFLKTAEGTHFMCYTNKQKTQQFVEQHLLPSLPSTVNIIFLKGKELHTGYDKKLVSRLLTDAQPDGGFPWLIRITDAKVYGTSINNDVYNAMHQEGKTGLPVTKLEAFFGD